MHTSCTHFEHTLHTSCTHIEHTLHTSCTHIEHTLHTSCTFFLQEMFPMNNCICGCTMCWLLFVAQLWWSVDRQVLTVGKKTVPQQIKQSRRARCKSQDNRQFRSSSPGASFYKYKYKHKHRSGNQGLRCKSQYNRRFRSSSTSASFHCNQVGHWRVKVMHTFSILLQ